MLLGAAGAAVPEGLAAVAARHGVVFGCAAHARWLGDARYRAALKQQAALLVPEGGGKWWDLRPREAVFDFRMLDALHALGLPMRGHVLVWHAAMRPWTLAALAEGAGRAQAVLEAHLDSVLAHTRDWVRDWDVANEAVANPWDSADLLKDSPWLRALGPGYLDLAFRAARARDATLRLTYNDYGCEHATEADAEKRRRVLALARGMRDRGVPLDAVGLQGHLHRDAAFDAAAVTAFVRELRALDLAVLVTELDVIEPATPRAPALRDQLAAARVHAFVSAMLEGGGREVLCWGISDRFSWAAEQPSPQGPARPLPLDRAFRRKPMWHALARAFAGQPLE